MYFKVIILSCLLIWSSEAYKIMVLAPMPLKSLSILNQGIVRHLLEAGHEITYITTYSIQNKNKKNFRQIDISDNIKALMGDSAINIAYLMENPNQVNDIKYLQDVALKIAISTFENKGVQNLLRDPKERFDVIISELYETELYAAIAALYNCPMIWSYSMGAHWLTLRLIDESTNPALTTDYLSPEVPPMDFSQRLHKLWLQIQWNYFKEFETKPKEVEVYRKYFEHLFAERGQVPPAYNDIIYNSSLILANDYLGNGLIPSTPQNFKFVGGFHIEVPPKPLPTDIKNILDDAKHGFIYFSMGSTWQSKDIPQSVTEGLLKVFGGLKETVIWKYEEDLPNLPKNIHLLKWAPQQSILAHPNCLFFITHGGHLSSTETIHFGVPTIGIPIFFDQFININKAVSNGFAIKVDLTFNLPQDLNLAIKEMLTNTTYKKKAKELSLIYHDRVVPPGRALVHWVEHVVKTKGALHLRSPALMTPWYQKMYLDLAALIIVIIFLSIFLTKRLCTSKRVYSKQKRN